MGFMDFLDRAMNSFAKTAERSAQRGDFKFSSPEEKQKFINDAQNVQTKTNERMQKRRENEDDY